MRWSRRKMSETVHYGQETDSERIADEKQTCRDIVKEISNFGVSQRQQLFIIYLLAMELENVEQMKQLTDVVRTLGGRELFLIDRAEDGQTDS
jgi:hypothetical protein